jgi:Antitoxin VbhA
MNNMSPEERTRRLQQVENARASVRIEGLEASPDGEAIFQRYVEGQMTLAEMGAALDELHDRQYGPVRISGE